MVGFFEYTIIKVTKNDKNISVDIGFIHIPQRLAEFASVLIVGFSAQTIGYLPVFKTIESFFGAYAFLSIHILKSK
jgi:hypothetical protein